MKSTFAYHEVPGSLTSDNGPQYAADQFMTSHISDQQSMIANPKEIDLQSVVRTVKNLLEKPEDPYVAIALCHGSTSLKNGYSPAELLMDRKLRTIIFK